MHKHAITISIWMVAALVLLILHWPGVGMDLANGIAGAPQSSEITTAASVSAAEHGKALFMAKGCASCHAHAAVLPDATQSIGPNLTTYQPDPEFVQRWLRDPQAIRPGTRMPNLNLRQEEIDALIAFLSANQAR